MPMGVGQGQNVGLRDFCHILTLLPRGHPCFTNTRLVHFNFRPKNNYIVVLSQQTQSVDWMFDFSFSKSGISTCSPIYSICKDTPNFC